ncbi:hypothetical protein BC826DRAFT_1084059 [Russula brevipes]|nr:hypothetical protein BC826DRAFT_1084059 [Russula brevipes]
MGRQQHSRLAIGGIVRPRPHYRPKATTKRQSSLFVKIQALLLPFPRAPATPGCDGVSRG